MEECLVQCQNTALDRVGSVVLDIDSLTHSSEKCSGSPKMTKALSRKGSSRMERRGNEEQEGDDASKKFVVKVVSSQLDQLKQPLAAGKVLVTVNSTANNPNLADSGDGRNKRLSRLTTMHPRKILLFFATMSSMGTMILIYFTLAINRRGGS
uniref:Terminal uridylyltransferase 7 n=1 Tax=Anthurium amnicola TaxID=1678845 RepID=A0A1D1XLS8_9ARAE